MDFDRFWARWRGRKVGKKQARRQYDKLDPDAALEQTILDAVDAQAAERERALAAVQFFPDWPHPSSWIAGRRWEDEVRHTAITPAQLNAARRHRSRIWGGRCWHTPPCEVDEDCLERLARTLRLPGSA